jgi:TetR/AcrR family transcriptional repressor of lmrAB and yxaGH operons
MTNDTKMKVIETTQNLMQTQGYNATGLNQIIKVSGTPKGSLYHHFPGGKEQLASEAIEASAREMGAKIHRIFDQAKTLDEALDAFVDNGIKELVESDFQCGCPIATVALEAAPGPVQQACQLAFRAAEKLLEGQLLIEGFPLDKAESLAIFLFSSFEGALVVSKARRDVTPLKTLKKILPAVLKKTD